MPAITLYDVLILNGIIYIANPVSYSYYSLLCNGDNVFSRRMKAVGDHVVIILYVCCLSNNVCVTFGR